MNIGEVKSEEKALEINIPGMLLSILKRIWIVILAAIITGAGAFIYFRSTYEPTYQTKVGLYIIGNKQDPAAVTSVQIATNIAKDYELLIKDPIVLDKVSAAIKEKGIELSASKLSKKISVVSPENTRILWITVIGESAENVQIIANAVRDAAYDELPRITNVPASKLSAAEKGTPTGSNVLRNTVVFAFLGACLAALVIAIIYVLEDKISTRKDIESRLGISVLGVIPNVLKARRVASEYKYYGRY